MPGNALKKLAARAIKPGFATYAALGYDRRAFEQMRA
jgi:hypothetical protein